MADLILRLVKGSPLTNAELDGNFEALNTAKLEASDLTAAATSYDNSSSALLANSVQAALDELSLKKVDVGDVRVGVTLFPTTSQVGGEYLLASSTADEIYDTTAVDVPTGVVSDDLLIATVVSEAGLIAGDIQDVTVHLVGNIRKTAGNNNEFSSFYYKMYHRDTSLGTDILLATSNTTPEVQNSSYQEHVADALITGSSTFEAEDKIVLEFYSSDVAGSPEYEFQFGGAQPVRFELPVALANIPHVNEASNVLVDTASFANVLDANDDTVQKALETIDSAIPTAVSDLTNDAGYLSAETDPVFSASQAATITGGDIASWNAAYSWGDHSQVGYITSYTVTEGDVTAHEAALTITESQISDLKSYLEDAPSDGSQYVREDGEWTSVQFAASLGELTDVELITNTPVAGQVLEYTGSGWANSTVTLDDLSSDISSIDGRVTANEGDIATLQGDVSTVEGDLATAQSDISTLQGDVSTAQGDITALQGDVSTAQGDITTLQGSVSTIEGDVSALDLRVTDNEAAIFPYWEDIEGAELSIAYDGDLSLSSTGATGVTGSAFQVTTTVGDVYFNIADDFIVDATDVVTIDAGDTVTINSNGFINLGTLLDVQIEASGGFSVRIDQEDSDTDQYFTIYDGSQIAWYLKGGVSREIVSRSVNQVHEGNAVHTFKDGSDNTTITLNGETGAASFASLIVDGDALDPADVAANTSGVASNTSNIIDLLARVSALEAAGGGSGGIEEAPRDGRTYVRMSGEWVAGQVILIDSNVELLDGGDATSEYNAIRDGGSASDSVFSPIISGGVSANVDTAEAYSGGVADSAIFDETIEGGNSVNNYDTIINGGLAA